MPKFEITVEREIPSYRERTTVVVEAESIEEIENYFDVYELNNFDLNWEEVMEGHGGFPIDYEINMIDKVDDSTNVDKEVQEVFDSCFEEEEG
jgi:hypothetical protein